MKRLAMVLGAVALVGVVAVPVFAWGPGLSWGHHMMGYWGNGPESANLSPAQESKLDALDRKFYDDTTDLRNQIWTKSRELDVALNSINPDLEKTKALQKEISELQANLDEQTLAYELEARKIVPDQRLGYGYGAGYGRHMGPYAGGMGYGQRTCWN